ncbi:hypothetical protein ACMA1D_32655 [Streptomyces sp. 796.1]|uniref:hypothetical protein n=1 Tax=Streptomyces sp. 796.1 TaxID=3163029 RepID=UPI0039C92C31
MTAEYAASWKTCTTPTQRLLEARHRNASEQELRDIVGDGAGESYFRVSPHSSGLHAVRLTNVDYIEFSY